MNGKPFTPEECAQLALRYPDTSAHELAAEWGRSAASIRKKAHNLGIRKTKEFIAEYSRRAMTDPSHGGCQHFYQKGHRPANKGVPQEQWMSAEKIARSATTRFKRGIAAHNHKPVGYERINKDGYIEVKVSEPNLFKAKHRVVWEAHHGPIPQGYNVQFADGNRQNVALENLYLITRAEQVRRNGISRYPREMQTALHRLSKLNKIIKKYETSKS